MQIPIKTKRSTKLRILSTHRCRGNMPIKAVRVLFKIHSFVYRQDGFELSVLGYFLLTVPIIACLESIVYP